MNSPHLISLSDWQFARLAGELLDYLAARDPESGDPLVFDQFSLLPNEYGFSQSRYLTHLIDRFRFLLEHLRRDLVDENGPADSQLAQGLGTLIGRIETCPVSTETEPDR